MGSPDGQVLSSEIEISSLSSSLFSAGGILSAAGYLHHATFSYQAVMKSYDQQLCFEHACVLNIAVDWDVDSLSYLEDSAVWPV